MCSHVSCPGSGPTLGPSVRVFQHVGKVGHGTNPDTSTEIRRTSSVRTMVLSVGPFAGLSVELSVALSVGRSAGRYHRVNTRCPTCVRRNVRLCAMSDFSNMLEFSDIRRTQRSDCSAANFSCQSYERCGTQYTGTLLALARWRILSIVFL